MIIINSLLSCEDCEDVLKAKMTNKDKIVLYCDKCGVIERSQL